MKSVMLGSAENETVNQRRHGFFNTRFNGRVL